MFKLIVGRLFTWLMKIGVDDDMAERILDSSFYWSFRMDFDLRSSDWSCLFIIFMYDLFLVTLRFGNWVCFRSVR